MANKKQQEKKKKKREKAVKAKVLAKREIVRKNQKLVEEERLKDKFIWKLEHGKNKPFVKNINENLEDEKNNRIKEQIQKNIEILEALEKQYEVEQVSRDAVNSTLESEGHMTIREKLDALHQKALKITGKDDELDRATKEYNENIVIQQQ